MVKDIKLSIYELQTLLQSAFIYVSF